MPITKIQWPSWLQHLFWKEKKKLKQLVVILFYYSKSLELSTLNRLLSTGARSGYARVPDSANPFMEERGACRVELSHHWDKAARQMSQLCIRRHTQKSSCIHNIHPQSHTDIWSVWKKWWVLCVINSSSDSRFLFFESAKASNLITKSKNTSPLTKRFG